MLSMPLKLYAFALLIKYATTIVPGPACVPIVDPSCDTGISPPGNPFVSRLPSLSRIVYIVFFPSCQVLSGSKVWYNVFVGAS